MNADAAPCLLNVEGRQKQKTMSVVCLLLNLPGKNSIWIKVYCKLYSIYSVSDITQPNCLLFIKLSFQYSTDLKSLSNQHKIWRVAQHHTEYCCTVVFTDLQWFNFATVMYSCGLRPGETGVKLSIRGGTETPLSSMVLTNSSQTQCSLKTQWLRHTGTETFNCK